MATVTQAFIRPAEGYQCREVATFISQMNDQSRRLAEAVHGITPQELEWQAAPGMNTMGMLLAHLAIVEASWTQIGLLRISDVDVRSAIGIGQDDDGMPLSVDGAAPAHLKGKSLAYYEDLLTRARAYYEEAAKKLPHEDLNREMTRTRPDGSQRVFNTRWVLYHVLEHFAGHFGQILLLRHLYRATVASPSR